MADSGSLRTKRWQLHKAGDHSLCRRGCVKPPAETLAVVPDPGAPVDVRESLAALARRLEAAHVADPANAVVARELRATLLALPPEDEVDPMAELRALSARVS
jgi:hypothetical protein